MQNNYRKLYNGNKIPAIGFGTYGLFGDECSSAVYCAIKTGYRLIDTAEGYNNEYSVGGGIKKALADGLCNREEIFITTKFFQGNSAGYDNVLRAFYKSLQELNVDFIDLYLIHWPNFAPKDKWKHLNAEIWKAMEFLYRQGVVKNLGISNFCIHHIEELFLTAHVKPVVNQLELSPIWQQKENVKFCKANDILLQAWSPLGCGQLLNMDVISQLAKKYQKTPSQICLNWSINNGFVPIPKTKYTQRMKQNFEVFDFSLQSKDYKEIDDLLSNPTTITPDCAYRYTSIQQLQTESSPKNHKAKFYLFNIFVLWKIKSKNVSITTHYLFGFIPIFTTKILSNNKSLLYLFNFIKIASIEAKWDVSIRNRLLPNYDNKRK